MLTVARLPKCATIDVTPTCNSHCLHCYFHPGAEPAGSLDDERWLERVTALSAREEIDAVFWVGGEPLLNPDRLRRALRLFDRNAVATSASVPIPLGLDAGLVVSLDGLEAEHDFLRGKGAFARALSNLDPLPAQSFVLNVTLTRLTLRSLARIPQLVEVSGAAGAVVGFFTGPSSSPLALPPEERSRVLDRLETLAHRHPEAVLAPPAALALLRPGAALAARCPYRAGDLAFDAELRPRLPCTFGAWADCEACGCPLIALRVASDQGDALSRECLRAVFRPRARA